MTAGRELSGSLQALSLSGLLQLLAAEGRTGQLDLAGAGSTGSLWLAGGQIVHATWAPAPDPGASSADMLDGSVALDALLGMAQGSFSFGPDVPAPARTLSGATEQLLMESAVRRDHARSGSGETMSPDAIPAFAPVPAGGATPRFTTLQWRVLAVIDGRKDVATLAAEVQLPPEALGAMLAELEAAGVIRIT